jgi:hypothetical protein
MYLEVFTTTETNKVFPGRQPHPIINKPQRFGDQIRLRHQGYEKILSSHNVLAKEIS